MSASLSWTQGLDSWWGGRNHEDLTGLWSVDQSIAFSTWINMVLPSGRSQLLAGAKTRLLLLFHLVLAWSLGRKPHSEAWSVPRTQYVLFFTTGSSTSQAPTR